MSHRVYDLQSAAVVKIVRVLRKNANQYRNATNNPKYWKLATYPASGTTHLIIDGWLSAGNDKQHLSAVYSSSIHSVDVLWEQRVRAFSYSGVGEQYVGDHTLYYPWSLVENLTHVLSWGGVSRYRNKWVVTAYSIGAPILLLALKDLIVENPEFRLKVPLVTLIEPATHGAPLILDAIASTSAMPDDERHVMDFDEIPPILAYLGNEQYEYSKLARSAVNAILDAGITIVIVYSAHDRIAPYFRIPDKRIVHREIPNEVLEINGMIDLVKTHFNIRNNEYVHRLVYSITRSLATLRRVP